MLATTRARWVKKGTDVRQKGATWKKRGRGRNRSGCRRSSTETERRGRERSRTALSSAWYGRFLSCVYSWLRPFEVTVAPTSMIHEPGRCCSSRTLSTGYLVLNSGIMNIPVTPIQMLS